MTKFKGDVSSKKDFKVIVRKQKTEMVRQGPNDTTCDYCKKRCHLNCAFGDGDDKKNCAVMNSAGFCEKCGHLWSQHIKYREIKQNIIEW